MKSLARWNLGLSGLLLGMVAVRLMLWPLARPAEARPWGASRPAFCAFIGKLGVVYLNDGVAPPAAFQNSSGTMTGDSASFQFYVVGEDDRFFKNVTFEAAERFHGRPALTVRVKAAPGSHEVAGHWFHSNSDNDYGLYYVPKRTYPKDRFAVMTFTYHCGAGGDYHTTFTLKIPAAPPAVAAPGSQ